MGAPPDPDAILRMLEDPNVAQQMNEAMNNPAVIDMMRQNPMLRNNPMAQQALENPQLRRMMFDPNFIRMQLNMQRQMGGGAASSFPAPGVTDTTESTQTRDQTGNAQQGQQQQQQQPNPFAMLAGMGGPNASGANPFAALFGGNPGAVEGTTPGATAPTGSAGQGTPAQGTPGPGAGDNPFANLFGAGGLGGAGADGQAGSNPFAEMTRRAMQNPEMMRNMMQIMGGGQGDAGAQAGEPFGGFNPFGAFGGQGQQTQPAQPADNRPPEERFAEQLRQLNDMGFFDFDRNVQALRRSGGNVQGAVEHLLS